MGPKRCRFRRGRPGKQGRDPDGQKAKFPPQCLPDMKLVVCASKSARAFVGRISARIVGGFATTRSGLLGRSCWAKSSSDCAGQIRRRCFSLARCCRGGLRRCAAGSACTRRSRETRYRVGGTDPLLCWIQGDGVFLRSRAIFWVFGVKPARSPTNHPYNAGSAGRFFDAFDPSGGPGGRIGWNWGVHPAPLNKRAKGASGFAGASRSTGTRRLRKIAEEYGSGIN